ncbi:hypothetical protein ACEPPN_014247 [Leptodophora sp. 'Broadleaf-Isolate-01']
MDLLPAELKDLIVSNVGKESLPSLRLVCKALRKPATRRLFSELEVKAHVQKVQHILASRLSTEVTSFQLHTEEETRYYGSPGDLDLKNRDERIIVLMGRFPNLRDVTSYWGRAPGEDEEGLIPYRRTADSNKGSARRFTALLETLSSVEHSHLRSLSFVNIGQYLYDSGLTSSPAFHTILGRISELRMSVKCDFTLWRCNFVPEITLWLIPAQSNLTSLTIHVNRCWGYDRQLRLRDLHFPNLKKLKLGNYMITHEWQLEWILSHSTLERLVLDTCSIVNYFFTYCELDDEKYPLHYKPVPWGDPEPQYQWEFDMQWSQLFGKIEQGLKHLKEFTFGIQNLKNGQHDYTRLYCLLPTDDPEHYSFSRNHCSKMTDEAFAVVGMYKEHYMAFNNTIGAWYDIQGFMKSVEEDEDWVIPIVDRSITGREDDEAAYHKLMATVYARACDGN